MVSKRKRALAEKEAKHAKKRRTAAPFDEDAVRRNNSAISTRMLGGRHHTPAPTLSSHQFNADDFIRDANERRFAMQLQPYSSPAPDAVVRSASWPAIKEEQNDSDAPTAIPAQQDTFSNAKVAEIATEIETAAVILSRHDHTHPLHRAAIANLGKVCISTHDTQVWAVRDRLLGHGVPQDRASHAASILREQTLVSVSIGEAAASLTDLDQLDGVLAALADGTPNGGIHAQLSSFRTHLRDQRQDPLEGNVQQPFTRSEAPERDYENIPPHENRSGSVFMAGGIGATPDADEAERPDVQVKHEATSDTEAGVQLVNSPVDTAKLLAQGDKQRVKVFKKHYPQTLDLFSFHVKHARKNSGLLQRLASDRCLTIAIDYFNAMEEGQRVGWDELHQQLLAGDSEPLEIRVGTTMLRRNGCFRRLEEEARAHEIPGAQTSSASQGVRFEIPSAAVPSTHGSASRGQELTLSSSQQADDGDALKPILILFRPTRDHKVRQRQVSFIVNTPGSPTCSQDLKAFRAACRVAYKQTVDLTLTRQPTEHHWIAVFHRRDEAIRAVKNKQVIKLGGVKIRPEILPSQSKVVFFCTLRGLEIADQDIAYHLLQAFAKAKGLEGEPLLTGKLKLYKYAKGRYYVCLPINISNNGLLHFYLPLPRPSGIHMSYWQPAKPARSKICGHCQGHHALPCPKAPMVELPSLIPASNHLTQNEEIEMPDPCSMFLFHIYEACKAKDMHMSRSDLDERAMELWRGFGHDHTQRWSQLHEALLAGDAAALEPATAEPLLAEYDLPGAITTALADGASLNGVMKADAEENGIRPSHSLDGEGDGDGAELYVAGREEEASAPSADDIDESDEESESLGYIAQPNRGLISYYHDFMFRPRTGGKRQGWIDEVIVPFVRDADHACTVTFSIWTPVCPVNHIKKSRIQKILVQQLGSKFQNVSKPFKGHTFSVRLGSSKMVRTALDNSTSIELGKYRIFAERLPAEDPTLFLCDLMGHQVPEKNLAIGVASLLQQEESCFQLLKYPEGQYLIRFSGPVRYLRVYVRILWSATTICIARFRPVDTTTPKHCAVCLGQHPWPCPQAEVVPLPKEKANRG